MQCKKRGLTVLGLASAQFIMHVQCCNFMIF